VIAGPAFRLRDLGLVPVLRGLSGGSTRRRGGVKRDEITNGSHAGVRQLPRCCPGAVAWPSGAASAEVVYKIASA
jgi:hypothetical protein